MFFYQQQHELKFQSDWFIVVIIVFCQMCYHHYDQRNVAADQLQMMTVMLGWRVTFFFGFFFNRLIFFSKMVTIQNAVLVGTHWPHKLLWDVTHSVDVMFFQVWVVMQLSLSSLQAYLRLLLWFLGYLQFAGKCSAYLLLICPPLNCHCNARMPNKDVHCVIKTHTN